MVNKAFIFVLGCAAAVTLTGCYSTRTYVVNKERVDQEIQGQAADTPVKTRKVVVFEVIEKDKAQLSSAEDGAQAVAEPASAQAEENNFDLPQSSPAVEKTEAAAVEPRMYVVEKDDTLQKISKKVYGAYSKWTKIYDANRDVIKDPNFLKAGITLKIPALETQAATENK